MPISADVPSSTSGGASVFASFVVVAALAAAGAQVVLRSRKA